jgi:anthranilate synthase component 1
MFHPSLDEFKQKAKKGNLIPVYRDILADMETPVSAFRKIDDGRHSFLLESMEGGEQRRDRQERQDRKDCFRPGSS